MTSYFGLVGTLLASGVALWIATMGWRRAERRAEQDKFDAAARGRTALLTELLELYLDDAPVGAPSRVTNGATRDAKMKAILLQLPGHLATVLRVQLRLRHTMKDAPLDPASAARLRPDEPHDADHKWLIFDRSSALTQRTFMPYPEWIEAELAYDIAGELGSNQDAVLHALSKDVRDLHDAVSVALQRNNEQSGSQTNAA
jgi:hypothetical protein